MSYNQFIKGENRVNNHEGAIAYKMSAEAELYAAVCTMALQPKFYETTPQQINRIVNLIKQVSPEFVAKLAIYARREMFLRSIPMLLIVELAKIHSGDNLVSRTIEQVVMRADEIMELLMCYQWRNPQVGLKKLNRLSHQVQKGLQKAFLKFDEYQYAKYNRTKNEVTLRDALFLIHPKAESESQQQLFDKIAHDTLEVPYTWETELSALGQADYDSLEAKQCAFRDKWAELIGSGKLGYMALLRNLRNIITAGVDSDMLSVVANRIGNAHEVDKAKQLPFRYLSAYKELKHVESLHTPLVLSALEQAALASATNVKGFSPDARVMIACDMSGSMHTSLSQRSKVQLYEVGLMLAMLLQHNCKQVITGIFGDEWEVVNLPQTNILANTEAVRRMIGRVGYGTDGDKPLEWLIKSRQVVDKVVYFTDCQFWKMGYIKNNLSQLWKDYKQIAPNAHLYLFDLAGYGHAPILTQQRDVTQISGWSDRIFDMLHAVECEKEVLEQIHNINL